MRAVFVLFDSLNRLSLECYGGDTVKTPNFKRLAERTVTFDTHYCGSLPCMPARREIMTGRVNFIHRSWGPVEPFDNAYPEHLAGAGVYSHLITDHQHYWEDGGATYHTRFDSCELVRGQESDPWKAIVDPDWDKINHKYHDSQNGTKPRTKFVRSM
ncbi:MAG: sulfatase-like hydrolase/transferase, partial [Rhodospirillales bacterium]|nr:sulfatase-like hydrolase/transferase [Rhodospirillales bacterium]